MAKRIILVLIAASMTVVINGKHSDSYNKIYKDNSPSVKQLLLQIAPNGQLPILPDGFPTLDNLKADTFDSVIKNGQVTAKMTLEDPVNLLGKGMTVRNLQVTFGFSKNGTARGHWSFNAKGKWRQGNMLAEVRIEESKVGNHHTLVAAADSLNVYQVASSISKRKSIESAGMNLQTLKNLTMKEVEIYSVFKGDQDYVFMISGKPFIPGTNAKDCKVFVRRQPKKKEVFTILLEFHDDLPSIDLLKLVSDDMFKIPFINHLIAQTRLFRTTKTNFGFVASTDVVEKLPLKSFGGGMLANELDSQISKGLTLLLPIQLGSANERPVRVAVEINPPMITFITGKHEDVSVAQTLKALSPTTKVSILPSGFPNLKKINIEKFTYNIYQETFYVHSHVKEEFEAIPNLLNLTDVDVVFRHRVGDQIDKWSFEGSGYTQFGGSVAKIVMGADSEDGKTLYFQGTSDKISIMELSQEHGISFVPDEESKKIVQSTKMGDFFFTKPIITSSYAPKDRKRVIHIAGKGHFPGVKTLTEAEVVLYDVNGKLSTAVGFIFPDVPMNSLINAVSGFDSSSLGMLTNSYNVSLVLSPQEDQSLFTSTTLSGLSFDRGMSMVGLIRVPEDCKGSRLCENTGTMLESNEWYRVKGLINLEGFNLDGDIERNFQVGNSLMLTDNKLDFTIGKEPSFMIHSKLVLPKENLTFFGSIDFDNDTVSLDMQSSDSIYRQYQGGNIKFDNLRITAPMLKLLPLKDLRMSGRINLGTLGSPTFRSADAVITYQPSNPTESHFEAKLSHMRLEELVNALEMMNITIPRVLSDAEFHDGFQAVYDTTVDKLTNFFVYGKMRLFEKEFQAVIKMLDSSTLVLDTDYAKSPFVISEGSVVIQKDKENSTGGPRLHVQITPKDTQMRLTGYAKVFGISTAVNVDISDKGTGFPVYGKLFDVNDVGFLISSDDILSSSEASEFKAYGCLDSIKNNVTLAAKDILKKAAHEADNFIAQAHDNLREAKIYYRKSTKIENALRKRLDNQKTLFRKREKDVWKSEEKYNTSCKYGNCKKACIGCPDWNRCCSHDVFGNCVECPSWNKCCYTTADPVCVSKNHGCQHIRKVAEGNLDDARDILADVKTRVDSLNKKLFDAEFSKGKTKAVLDAAAKALSLIDHDSSTGIRTSKALKQYGINKLVNVTSLCFNAPLESLTDSCVNVWVNFSTSIASGGRSLNTNACLNKDVVSNLGQFVANSLFPDVTSERHRRSLLSEENDPGARYEMPKDDEPSVHKRRRRSLKGDWKKHSNDTIEPFWDLIPEHDPLKDDGKPAADHPTKPARATLKRKWKIPASQQGRCKTYHQLLNICRDMMKTVKHMYASYMFERYMFAKEKDTFRRKLRRVTKQLEASAKRVSGTHDQMAKIEKSLNFLSNGVRKWMDKSSKSIHKQDMISVKAWVKGMDTRIKSLGGEGVNRFLTNLFKAFNGLFDSSNIKQKDTAKALTVLQRIKKIAKAFNQIFNKNLLLGKANYYADRVLYDIAEIESVPVYCVK